jgi:hypothetical protein
MTTQQITCYGTVGVMTFKNQKLWLVVLILIVLIVFIFTMPSWWKLCYRCEDVDIKSGRIRHTRYLFYCKISEKIDNTILTEALGESAKDVQPDWRRVSTFSLGIRHSTHYVYHGAIVQIRLVGMIWQMSPFSDEAKRQVARTILDKWQADGHCFGVDNYIRDLGRIVGRKTKFDSEAIISVADLPSARNE